ncbi:hypothetical protein NC651_029999 [Populus alba x Populus x berolinensis]|nr:hypothetical protein NC651_029996 [Populus alba x Populus x berolinensis]KAJ6877133.1 hypothetical protein NC651_029999 [Populus alba x Populus x berolinensis]
MDVKDLEGLFNLQFCLLDSFSVLKSSITETSFLLTFIEQRKC